MKYKGSLKYKLVDSTGKVYKYDLFNVNYKYVKDKKQKLEMKTGRTVFYIDSGFQYDIYNINSNLLCEDIDYAFKAWNLPWASKLSFENFCKYLLPYRIDKEPLQQWRKFYYEQNINWVLDSMKNSNDLLRLCGIINNKIQINYSYRHNEIAFFPGILTMKQAGAFGGGRCEDLNMVAAYIMRAVGIPIASEFSPYWEIVIMADILG